MVSTVFGSFTPQELMALRKRWGWLLAFGLAACDGDTVYTGDDPADVAGPTVEIRSPGTGDQVTSGRTVAVEIAAADTLGVTEIELTYRGVATGTQTFPIVPARQDVVVGANVALPGPSV